MKLFFLVSHWPENRRVEFRVTYQYESPQFVGIFCYINSILVELIFYLFISTHAAFICVCIIFASSISRY